jgi:hypothetical protein
MHQNGTRLENVLIDLFDRWPYEGKHGQASTLFPKHDRLNELLYERMLGQSRLRCFLELKTHWLELGTS